MYMKRFLTLLLILFFVGMGFSASAENKSTDKDGVISSLRGRVVSPKVGKFSFFFDQEIRSTTTFGAIRDSRTSLFVVYDPMKWLKLSGGYTFLVKEGDDEPSLKHRYILAIEETLGLGNFKFTLRERFESTHKNGYLFDDSINSDPTNLFRTRLKISYSNGKQKVVPYIYTELYNHTNEDMLLSRVRSQMGVDYSVCKGSKITMFYQYAHYVKVSSSTAPHTIGALYTYTFGKKK